MPIYRAAVASAGRVRGVTFGAESAREAASWAHNVLRPLVKAEHPTAEVLTVKEIESRWPWTRQRRLEI